MEPFSGACAVSILVAAEKKCNHFWVNDVNKPLIKMMETCVDTPEKLAEILKNNNIQDITLLRMEVPCGGGLAAAAEKALKNSKKSISLETVIVSINGNILEN